MHQPVLLPYAFRAPAGRSIFVWHSQSGSLESQPSVPPVNSKRPHSTPCHSETPLMVTVIPLPQIACVNASRSRWWTSSVSVSPTVLTCTASLAVTPWELYLSHVFALVRGAVVPRFHMLSSLLHVMAVGRTFWAARIETHSARMDPANMFAIFCVFMPPPFYFFYLFCFSLYIRSI